MEKSQTFRKIYKKMLEKQKHHKKLSKQVRREVLETQMLVGMEGAISEWVDFPQELIHKQALEAYSEMQRGA